MFYVKNAGLLLLACTYLYSDYREFLPYRAVGSSRLKSLYYSRNHFEIILTGIFSKMDSPK